MPYYSMGYYSPLLPVASLLLTDAPSLRLALDIENRTQIMCTSSGEATTASQAFVEHRRPEWSPL